MSKDLDDGVVSIERRIPWPSWTLLFGSILVIMVACDSAPETDENFPPGTGAQIPAVAFDAPGRPAAQLNEWASGMAAKLGIPVTSLEAYGYAAAAVAQTDPECGIGWTTLAGIARVESRHGEHDGSTVAADGTIRPGIRGIPLDGRTGVAHIRDTDRGVLDGDKTFDRAVGPFQFIPSTWVRFGVDANGDGIASPDNIDDAGLTAARYLCASGGDLRTSDGWQKAVLAYNHSMEYVREVKGRADEYHQRSTD